MNETDKTIRLLNDGKMAGIVLDHCGQIIEQAKKSKIDQMAVAFKSGKADVTTLVAGIAGFCALDDLERDLIRRITKGNMASAEIHRENDNGTG